MPLMKDRLYKWDYISWKSMSVFEELDTHWYRLIPKYF